MKKNALTMVAMFAFATTSFANNETGAPENKIETTETTTTSSKESDEDAWYCEVNINGKISYCYLCDCAEFVKALKGSSEAGTKVEEPKGSKGGTTTNTGNTIAK